MKEDRSVRRLEGEKLEVERKKSLRHFRDLEVYRRRFDAVMEIFQIAKEFPVEEKFSLVDQIRRSSRSVLLRQRRSRSGLRDGTGVGLFVRDCARVLRPGGIVTRCI